jgi:hypothetical protein
LEIQNTTSIGYRPTIFEPYAARESLDTQDFAEAAAVNNRQGISGDCSGQCGVGIETVSGNL